MKSKKVAIIQSNYIPWKGYFDIINQVDEFILYDDVQYTRRDWRNRNKIKLKSEEQALLGTDTKRRQQAARDAVARESNYKNWEDMEAQEKSIQNAYKFQAGIDTYKARQASVKRVNELEAKAELRSRKNQEDYARDEVAQMIRAEEQSIRAARGTDFAATRKALEREREVLDNIKNSRKIVN